MVDGTKDPTSNLLNCLDLVELCNELENSDGLPISVCLGDFGDGVCSNGLHHFWMWFMEIIVWWILDVCRGCQDGKLSLLLTLLIALQNGRGVGGGFVSIEKLDAVLVGCNLSNVHYIWLLNFNTFQNVSDLTLIKSSNLALFKRTMELYVSSTDVPLSVSIPMDGFECVIGNKNDALLIFIERGYLSEMSTSKCHGIWLTCQCEETVGYKWVVGNLITVYVKGDIEMGHRHPFSTSQMFESEPDQNWNHMHTEQPYEYMARAAGDNGSFFHPVENMFVDGMHFNPHWNPVPRSTGYSSSSHSVGLPHYPTDASGPSHDPYQHPLSAGTFTTVAENYAHHASSSNYDRHAFHGVDGGFVDLTMGNGRGLHKRKSPGIPSSCERGSTSRYYSAGSSSDIPIPSELRHEKVGLDVQHMPRDRITMAPSYRGNGLSIRGEGSMRNVRSRSAHDLESNLSRAHLSSNPSHNSYSTGHPIDHSSAMDLSGQTSGGLTRDWNHISASSSHGRILASDTNGFSHEPTHFLLGSSVSNEEYHHDFIPSRSTAVPQSYPGTSAQSIRGVRSSYSQRTSPNFRASSSSLRLGHVAPSDDGLQLVTESYPRHPRPPSNIGWRNSDRNGRPRISNERYRLLSDEPGLHDRFSSEGFMVVDRSAFYGSRNMFDQHRDMRLDIDNMSYEELLALGERIGNVNTGLSEDLIAKCLTETIYCSSDQIQEEGSCVICLEEYNNMDDVGALKTCGHDYHVNCIKKWLSMKNSCPICKGSVLSDKMK
ncbi:hypothetical protein FNV43_RR16773 [Rhamnella rubrinervis]|uniref:RING-type E3 ubiquitin transferase n=1 Tax=Rhamnella rubrinervis TaxID=2594499 RepID=A0A8K0GZG4_9ROSA|nr:hypothetical protein FNV43_RR16773 [Rhamnella rubrinervis]